MMTKEKNPEILYDLVVSGDVFHAGIDRNPSGWMGRGAEWVALGCLHSGIFTRVQFCHYFDTDRKQVLRFVKRVVTFGVPGLLGAGYYLDE